MGDTANLSNRDQSRLAASIKSERTFKTSYLTMRNSICEERLRQGFKVELKTKNALQVEALTDKDTFVASNLSPNESDHESMT